MQKFKIFVVSLLFWSLASYASPLKMPTAEHPFIKIATVDNNSASLWIGAFGAMLPYKTDKGDIVIITLMKSEISTEGHPKGQTIEYAVLADCKQHIAKILPFWKKADAMSPGVNIFNVTGAALDEMIAKELNKQEVQDIGPGSVLEIAVSSGCHYLGETYTPANVPKHKEKPREWKV